MENRSKGRTRTQTGLSDAARPDETAGDYLEPREELDIDEDVRRTSSSASDHEPLLAEGEPVGAWSDDEDEEDNAFDAASGDSESEEEDDDVDGSPASTARFADDEGDDAYQAQPPHSRDRHRGRNR
jgi:hypothetical protein